MYPIITITGHYCLHNEIEPAGVYADHSLEYKRYLANVTVLTIRTSSQSNGANATISAAIINDCCREMGAFFLLT